MSIPAGHRLADPRHRSGVYTARCGCGLDVYGRSLPELWASHDRHLHILRTASQSRHPSQKEHS